MKRINASNPICIGFVMTGVGWTGGINYYRSLFDSISLASKGKYRVVLVTAPGGSCKAKTQFGNHRTVETLWVRGTRLTKIIRALIRATLGRDWILEQTYSKMGLDISSHGPALGIRSSIPSIVWIPDFQHLHLPHFFPGKMAQRRTENYRRLSRNANCVIVSSQNAKDDLDTLLAGEQVNSRVLKFVPSIPTGPLSTRNELKRRYNLSDKYLFLPNQFWSHKNHATVVAAMKILCQEKSVPLIVCSGDLSDFRNPKHINEIQSEIIRSGIIKYFRLLGSIPYQDVFDLMYYSHGVINPSLFEGWSTTVEEAKLLNKKLVLSDIPVHREQAAGRAIFFPPKSPKECANAIQLVWKSESDNPDPLFYINARVALEEFGDQYISIVSDCISQAQSSSI